MALERTKFSDPHRVAAGVLARGFGEIVGLYEERLRETGSPLVATDDGRERLRSRARSILEGVVVDLRGGEDMSTGAGAEDPATVDSGGDAGGAWECVHAAEFIRAMAALSEAALDVMVEGLPRSFPARETAGVALAVSRAVAGEAAEATIAYGDFFLRKLHEARADERRRISRELHDRVAHSIMVIFRNLELYELYKDKDPARAGHKLRLAAELAQEALDQTREMSLELRSSAEEGLEAALSNLLCLLAPEDARTRLVVEGEESLVPPGIREELFLVLREAIRNAAAHSEARKINVEVRITKGEIRATVGDDGRGFERSAAPVGAGIVSMEERVLLLGGSLKLDSEPGCGTRVEVLVPLPRPAL